MVEIRNRLLRPATAQDLPPTSVHEPVPFARRLVRAASEGIGTATSQLRVDPAFLVVGAKRSGTTSLYFYLLQHPQVMPMFPSANYLPMASHRKGAHYFDTNSWRSPAWYRGHFPLRASQRIVSRRVGHPVVSGEASPYYLFHPMAAERAHRVVPNTKIIAVLRDPVERAFSHYKEQRRRRMEPIDDFAAALAAEPGRLAGEAERLIADERALSYPHEHQSYQGQGAYMEGLRRWTDRYPAEQVLILRSEDLFASPQGVYDEVARFLGLERHELARTDPHNASDRSKMDPDIRAVLTEHFAPLNRELEEFLGRSMGWG